MCRNFMSRMRLSQLLFIFILLFSAQFGWCNEAFSKKVIVQNLEGTLEIRGIFYARPNSNNTIEYHFRTHNGVDYNLRFTDNLIPSKFKTDDKIRIRHAVEHLRLNGDRELELSTDDMELISSSLAIPSSLGPQRTLVMLVNFQNQPTNRPWTTSAVNTTVFGTVNNFFYEASYNQTTLVGKVVGWYTLPIDSTASCSTITDNLPTLANDAARRAGTDLSQYTRYVYLFPRSTCGWGGLGTIGGNPSKAWINGYNHPFVFSHELGHNLGLHHSNRLRCTTGPNTGSCSVVSYGDNADTMGGSWVVSHFNAFQKDRLGWLNYLSSPPITRVTTSGYYLVTPYETRSGAKALKILKQTLSDGSQDFYYVELRTNTGFDTSLNCTGCDYLKGVLVHQGNSRNGNTSNLLDMTWSDNNAKLVALLPGKSFSDPTAQYGGITVTLHSISANGALVYVKFGA